MRGRKPKLRVVDGDAPLSAAPPPPSVLDRHASEEWRRVAPILAQRGLLTEAAVATLENYCRAVGLCRVYTETMEREGHTVQTARGTASHPCFKMLTAMMREARLLAAELALTPHRQGQKGDSPSGDEADGWDADLLA
jgi:P27 family predicted phage terminase small subunit